MLMKTNVLLSNLYLHLGVLCVGMLSAYKTVLSMLFQSIKYWAILGNTAEEVEMFLCQYNWKPVFLLWVVQSSVSESQPFEDYTFSTPIQSLPQHTIDELCLGMYDELAESSWFRISGHCGKCLLWADGRHRCSLWA